MTLGECFESLSANPSLIALYFILMPIAAFLGLIFGKNEGHESPWKYFYSALVYLICIPGIFAITLNIYLFLFERISIFDANVYTQIFPIFSMMITLWLIKKNVDFDEIPGFNRLSALFTIIFVLLALMWFLEKTRIFAFTFIPFHYVIILFIVFFVIIRFGAKIYQQYRHLLS